jgi:hypothetical protein
MPKLKEPLLKEELEDCKPGATRNQVFLASEKVAQSPKQPSQRRGQPPVSTLS